MTRTVFAERDGVLFAEDCSLIDIARRFDTPAYVYSAAGIQAQAAKLQAAFATSRRPPDILFACKANGNLAVLGLMNGMGIGMDIVSGGELRRALAAGTPSSRIVFSGVGKADAEIAAALDTGIRQFNVESAPELERIAAIAASMGRVAPVALRYNPDVVANTHAKITTGKEDNKFGVSADELIELYCSAARNPALDPCGLSIHIGSQLTDIEPFRQAFRKLADLSITLRGMGLCVRRLDLGGGIGVRYRDEATIDLDDYAGAIRDTFDPLDVELMIEPGRFLVAESGVLLTRLRFVKVAGRRFLILDAGMNDLIRPALYEAWHDIRPVRPRGGTAAPCDIVGPVCETGDTFALERMMPPVEPGDLLAIMNAGAYGFSMASTYNSRPLPPEILVEGTQARAVRRRQTIEDMLGLETI